MAAAATRVVQAVKPHLKLIKFPNRNSPQATSAANTEVTDRIAPERVSAPFSFPAASTYSPPSERYPATYGKPVGSTTRGSGTDHKQLSAKYRRKPMDTEELNYINRGGPE